MDEELKTEGVVNNNLTAVKNAISTDSCNERLSQVSQYKCPNNEISSAGDRDDPEHPHGVKGDLCGFTPAGTVTVTVTGRCGDAQRPTQVRNKHFTRDVTVRLCEEEDMSDRDVVSGRGTAPDHQPETSDTPLSDFTRQWDAEFRTVSAPQALCDDEETARKAREEGRVDIVFPGSVTQDSCCRFVCELLKCILYQRQQLPMTYDQMVFFQKQQHTTTPEDAVARKPTKPSGGVNWHRGQRTLQELDDVLIHLEALFSLTHVPRVLFMLGGSNLLPAELYEVDMEAVVVGGGVGTLRTSSCLRQLFRTLFVADLLSDVRPVRLMATTVMALGHRDCGVAWFKPKLDFKVPARVKRHVISLACDTSTARGLAVAGTQDWDDYIWFQAPVTVKGFCK
ncbi:MAD2L1-binding protein [Brachyhypopomus gauderio]|uniref:MAD2L1-binding protein n=1 Tax=Brachyhypopomus gauderio TaxID=698409 RepID=UPI004041659B